MHSTRYGRQRHTSLHVYITLFSYSSCPLELSWWLGLFCAEKSQRLRVFHAEQTGAQIAAGSRRVHRLLPGCAERSPNWPVPAAIVALRRAIPAYWPALAVTHATASCDRLGCLIAPSSASLFAARWIRGQDGQKRPACPQQPNLYLEPKWLR